MDNRKYEPHPIDTSGMSIPPELCPLVEALAKNVHEVWAQGRMEQGWTYGPERDDQQRKHPCLVPYEELSEQEKDYDRNTCKATLLLVLKQGYEIKRIGSETE